MRGLFIFCVVLLISFNSNSQAPEAFKYQSVLRDSTGKVLSNQDVSVRLSILQGNLDGEVVYSEIFSRYTNEYGVLNLEIGKGSASGGFNNINWGNGPFYIETAIDVNGGVSFSEMGKSQLLSVPYALHAKTAESVVGREDRGFYVGLDTLGGIVFNVHIGADGFQHGLIVAKTESVAIWSSANSSVNANSSWDGNLNSNLNSSSPAVAIAKSYGAEWYLPSIDELSLLNQNKYIINKYLDANAQTPISSINLIGSHYWSSSEFDSKNAMCFIFSHNSSAKALKDNPFKVRAIRSF